VVRSETGVLTVLSFGPWTSLRQSRACGNRYRPLVSLGTLWWRDMANVMSILHPTECSLLFLRSGTAGDVSSEHEFIQPEVSICSL